MEMVTTLKELLHLHPLYNEQLKNFVVFGAEFDDPSRLSDMGASLTTGSDDVLQGILEELSVPARCAQAQGLGLKSWAEGLGLMVRD